jgi:hypothetical protein
MPKREEPDLWIARDKQGGAYDSRRSWLYYTEPQWNENEQAYRQLGCLEQLPRHYGLRPGEKRRVRIVVEPREKAGRGKAK